MNIAIDTNCIIPGKVGGIEHYVYSLVESLKEWAPQIERLVLLTRPENHRIFQAYRDSRTSVVLVPRPTLNNEPVTNWPALLDKHPAVGRELLAAYQEQKMRIVRGMGVEAMHFPGYAINPVDIDIPAVLNIHDLQHRHLPQFFTEAELENREKWWPASARRADVILANSDFIARDIAQQFGVAPTKIMTAIPPIQAIYHRIPSAERLAEVKMRLHLPDTFFLYPAAAWAHKNQATLIRAFLAANVPGAQLLLTGGNQQTSPLPDLIRQLGAESRVRLTGYLDVADLHALYHLSKGLIFVSKYEAWSFPIMEAMASGCPVASSDVTSLPELMTLPDGRACGILYNPDDVGAIAEAIQWHAYDAEHRARSIERGRARVAAFTPQRFVETVTAAYRTAIANFKSVARPQNEIAA